MFFLLQLSNIVYAETESELLYLSSIDSYDAFKYEDSIKKLLGAIEKEPNVAKYHHLLAKSYGKEAEKSGWLRAVRYAKKTLHHLELASKLDVNNIEILKDLMKYYNDAPMFLGGSSKKASKIETKIKVIQSICLIPLELTHICLASITHATSSVFKNSCNFLTI